MTLIKHLLVVAVGLVATVYLVNPTAGFLEFIPDNLPFVGNLDEATAMLLLVNCLAYFGIDVSALLKKKKDEPQAESPARHLEDRR